MIHGEGTNGRVLQGVPLNKDIGEHFISVRAVGHHPSDAAKDLFSVEVVDRHQDLEVIKINKYLV